MNKLFTKIASLTVGLAMAIGVGVAIGKGSKEVSRVEVDAAVGDTHDFSQSLSQLLNNNASISSVGVAEQSYYVSQIKVVTSWNNATNFTNGVTVTPTIGSTTLTSQYVNSKNQTLTFSVNPVVKGALTVAFTNNTGSGTGHGTFKCTKITLTEGEEPASEYTLSYNGNGSTGGSVPASPTTYDAGTTVTVLGNTNSLVKVVGGVSHTFNNWNTAANGSGVAYAAGDTFALNANTTLYAQWINPNQFTATASNLTDMSTSRGELTATYQRITFNISDGLRDGTNHVRVYSGATLTISCARKILEIAFTGVSGNPVSNLGLESGGGTFTTEGDDGSWTGESNSVVFSATAQARISKFVVTLEPLNPITSLTMDSTHEMFEGQSWTPTITYNDSATVKTSEIVVVSGGDYITISSGTISAKNGVMETSSVTVVVKAHATDVDNSEVYSANCTITINKNTVTKIEVTTNPSKTSYVEGQKLNLTGMVLTLTWTSGDPTTISSGYEGVTTTPSLNTSLTVASHNGIEVLVTYSGQTTAANDGFVITVVAKAITSITNWTGATTTYEIGATLVADGTITVSYNDESSGELDVAELWSNSLATFKLGDTTVTPGTTSLTAGDNGKHLTITYSGKTRYITLTVKNADWKFMVQVTSLGDLNYSNGSYVIAAHDEGDVFLMTSKTPNGAQIAGVDNDASWNDTFGGSSIRTLRADLTDYEWTLSGSANAAVFTDVSGNALGYDSSTNFGTSNTSWKITASGKSYGTFVITNNNTTTRVAGFNASTNKFGAFSTGNTFSAGGYQYVEIYRVFDIAETTLDNWSDTLDYFNEINCNNSGSYTFNTSKTWGSMEEQFDDLDLDVKAYLKHASYSFESGTNTTTATLGTDSSVASFVSKYDYIIDKYGWSDFIQRDGTTYDLFDGSNIQLIELKSNVSDSTTTLIIVLISTLSILSIGGYFLLRKRKEHN